MDNNRSSAPLVGGLAAGLVAGVALGVLLAPKNGRETRELFRKAIDSGMERVRRRGESNT